MIFIFYSTGPKGLKSSLSESKYKYKVAYWLEELARTLNSFKLAGDSFIPIKKTDQYTNNYLIHRKAHFKVLISQLSYIIVFKAMVTGGVLVLGSILVIDQQITLGQFVASEIIIILTLSSVEKIITYMDVIYDMLTAVDKIGNVTDLPLEKTGGIRQRINRNIQAFPIRAKNLKYRYAGTSKYVLNNINLEIKPGERIGFAGFNDAGKSTLMNILAGMYTEYEGLATINNFSIRNLDLIDVRNHISKNISQDDIFDGTIMDNIAVGKAGVGYEDVMESLDKVGLKDYINELPDGLDTTLVSGGKTFSNSVINKIILSRCLVKNPKILILNDFFHNFHKGEKQKLIEFLVDKSNPWTFLTVSNDPLILSKCDRVVILKDGEISYEGTFNECFEKEDFRDIILSKVEKNLA